MIISFFLTSSKYFLICFNRAEVNKVDNFKWTALHHACHAGQVRFIYYYYDDAPV